VHVMVALLLHDLWHLDVHNLFLHHGDRNVLNLLDVDVVVTVLGDDFRDVDDLFLHHGDRNVNDLLDVDVVVTVLADDCRDVDDFFLHHGDRNVNDLLDMLVNDTFLLHNSWDVHDLLLHVGNMDILDLLNMNVLGTLLLDHFWNVHNFLNHHWHWDINDLLDVAVLNALLGVHLGNVDDFNLLNFNGLMHDLLHLHVPLDYLRLWNVHVLDLLRDSLELMSLLLHIALDDLVLVDLEVLRRRLMFLSVTNHVLRWCNLVHLHANSSGLADHLGALLGDVDSSIRANTSDFAHAWLHLLDWRLMVHDLLLDWRLMVHDLLRLSKGLDRRLMVHHRLLLVHWSGHRPHGHWHGYTGRLHVGGGWSDGYTGWMHHSCLRSSISDWRRRSIGHGRRRISYWNLTSRHTC